jgi:hypothetical protein
MMAGRKPLPERTLLIRASLTLRAGEDDDLIKAFQSVPARKRAAFIKAAMRSGSFQSISYDDLPSDDELEQSIADFLE